MTNKMSTFEVACKVDSEGGVAETFIGYGLNADYIADPTLSDLVRRYQAAYPRDLEDKIMNILDDADHAEGVGHA